MKYEMNGFAGAHGALRVCGSDLVDSKGEKIQLRGMSTHGMAWYPQFVCRETFAFMRDSWKINCVRLAMYTYEPQGYCTDGDKEALKALVRRGVDAATELGLYVIVDWHILNDRNPLVYQSEAIAFFDEMSRLYADHENVLYEICNEPNTSASWEDVTAYANAVIPVIRANAPDSVILVGTPTWSQDIHLALAQPLEFPNLMYTLHFYAATHKQELRDRMRFCMEQGLPVFVSEFGICDASGNGALDYEQAAAWQKLIMDYNASFMCWNLSNCDESSAILRAKCTKLSGWEDEDMNDQGKWISRWFISADR